MVLEVIVPMADSFVIPTSCEEAPVEVNWSELATVPPIRFPEALKTFPLLVSDRIPTNNIVPDAPKLVIDIPPIWLLLATASSKLKL